MAFGDVKQPDHDDEAAEQAKIASQVVEDEPQDEQPKEVVSEAKVAGETADPADAAAAEDADDIVTVQLVDGAEVAGEPVTHCRIAGVVVEPEGTEVPRSVALLLAEDSNVEIVEETD